MGENHGQIAGNVRRLRDRLAECAVQAGRQPNDIALVAVAKNRTAGEVSELIKAGVDQIGENRVKEAMDKHGRTERGFTLRMVGHLQNNKAVKACRFFDTIDSVDSVRLAERLNGSVTGRQPFPILLQVNISGEQSKWGFAPKEVNQALEKIGEMDNLEVEGLMTIGPLTNEKAVVRDAFRQMKELFEDLRGMHGLTILSMGMTEDFDIAIQEGSTMIRVGRILFERGWL